MGKNSGESRNRFDFVPVIARKLPQLRPPFDQPALSFQVPKLPSSLWTNPEDRAPKPDFVVTVTTRLVLPPKSAGGAPVIAVSESMISGLIWFAKTLACWSVMGCPSSEIEVSACSPKG